MSSLKRLWRVRNKSKPVRNKSDSVRNKTN